MQTTKRIIAAVLSLAFMLFIANPMVAWAADVNAGNAVTLVGYITGATEPMVITLTADIPLAALLGIPSGKDITLKSGHTSGNPPYRLIGANGADTIENRGTLVLDGITVTHNVGEDGVGVYNTGAALLTLKSGKISGNSDSSGAGVFNSGTFDMSGGEISGNTATSLGGGVYNNTNASFTIQGGKISGNTAEDGGGVFNFGVFAINGGEISDNTAVYDGGGVCNYAPSLTMSNGTISRNSAEYGGGIFARSGNSLTLNGGTISGNTATEYGGGVYSDIVSLVMNNGTVSENEAPHGGGLYIENNAATFALEGGTISGNISNGHGGGVFSNAISSTMKAGVISGNEAHHGGGIYLTNASGTFTMQGGMISNNIANGGGSATGGHGGGVFSRASSFTMSSSEVSANRASHGGGLYIDNGLFAMNSGNISGNQADRGGGIFVYQLNTANAQINGGAISNNRAAVNGGGIWVTDSRVQSALQTLSVANGVVFSGNRAANAYDRNPADNTIYSAQIQKANNTWSASLPQGYNNYDISYVWGHSVTFPVPALNPAMLVLLTLMLGVVAAVWQTQSFGKRRM
ncbi:MAG: hypothetical protein LBP90_03075 [Burkholderiales bacterium]|nr:hypothetical protein [Burkholderiales bacterium]